MNQVTGQEFIYGMSAVGAGIARGLGDVYKRQVPVWQLSPVSDLVLDRVSQPVMQLLQ